MANVRVAFIYGSTARGAELASSDVDLMVIGDVDLDTLDNAIDSIEEEVGRTVNYTLFSMGEWQERVRVIDAVKMVLEYTGHRAEIKLLPDMPTGPLNRVADNSLAKKLLDWEPQVPFREGLKRTIDWYFTTKDREQVKKILDRMLTER